MRKKVVAFTEKEASLEPDFFYTMRKLIPNQTPKQTAWALGYLPCYLREASDEHILKFAKRYSEEIDDLINQALLQAKDFDYLDIAPVLLFIAVMPIDNLTPLLEAVTSRAKEIMNSNTPIGESIRIREMTLLFVQLKVKDESLFEAIAKRAQELKNQLLQQDYYGLVSIKSDFQHIGFEAIFYKYFPELKD